MTDLVKAINNSDEEILSKKLGKITRQRLRAEKRKMLKERRTFQKASAMKNKEMGGSSKIRNLEFNVDFNLLE